MARGDADDDDAPLEVIDLEPELAPQPATRGRPSRRRFPVMIGAASVAVVLVVALIVSRHHDAATPPAAGTVGRFFPALDSDSVRLVLPSGVAITLTGDARRTMSGLGATFAGGIGSIDFRIARSVPSDLFRSLGPRPIRTAVAVAGSDARARDLIEYGGRLAVLSSGGWTLVAFLSDDEQTANTELQQMAEWQLGPGRDGVIVRSLGTSVGDASVVLVADGSRPLRRVELTDDNCAGTSVRTESRLGDTATGNWCYEGVYVRITGRPAFVEHALATLRVEVSRLPVPS